MTTWLYDGTFDGFLSAVFDMYWQRRTDVRIRKEMEHVPAPYEEAVFIPAVPANAERVWTGLTGRLSPDWLQRLFACYLAEQAGEEDNMIAFIRYVFVREHNVEADLHEPHVRRVKELSQQVRQEQYAMEEQLRLQLEEGSDLYYAVAEPVYNVLPLTAAYFRQRYAAQRWLIYDLERRYGIYYNGKETATVVLLFDPATPPRQDIAAVWRPDPAIWQLVAPREEGRASAPEDRRLPLRYMPKGYWKYLYTPPARRPGENG